MYLGSIHSKDASITTEVGNEIRAASYIFDNKDLKIQTNILVYRAVVVATLLYGCKTWTLYRSDIEKLERFHMAKLFSILCIKQQDKVTKNEVLQCSGLLCIETLY